MKGGAKDTVSGRRDGAQSGQTQDTPSANGVGEAKERREGNAAPASTFVCMGAQGEHEW